MEKDRVFREIIFKRQSEDFVKKTDSIVEEKAVTLLINEEEIATLVCSPWELDYILYGFLLSEGLVHKKEEIKRFEINEEKGEAFVEIHNFEKKGSKDLLLKRFHSCCGKSRASVYFSNDALLVKEVTSPVKITEDQILSGMEKLEEEATLFKETGGVHSAALYDGGNLLSFHKDIGRHNTLDRILGQAFLEGLSLEDKMVLFSGRIASEIVLKISKMGIPILLSRSAPSSLALDLAEDLGITVIGFIRGNRFTIYTHPERVVGAEKV